MPLKQITIKLVEDPPGVFHAIPEPQRVPLALEDEVVYRPEEPDREFRVVFEMGSPFSLDRQLTIADSNPRKVQWRGMFLCQCFITKPDGTMVGWRPNEEPSALESGGEHDVRP